MNMAMMDAAIGVWEVKYTSFTIRPWLADPQIFVTPRLSPYPRVIH